MREDGKVAQRRILVRFEQDEKDCDSMAQQWESFGPRVRLKTVSNWDTGSHSGGRHRGLVT